MKQNHDIHEASGPLKKEERENGGRRKQIYVKQWGDCNPPQVVTNIDTIFPKVSILLLYTLLVVNIPSRSAQFASCLQSKKTKIITTLQEYGSNLCHYKAQAEQYPSSIAFFLMRPALHCRMWIWTPFPWLIPQDPQPFPAPHRKPHALCITIQAYFGAETQKIERNTELLGLPQSVPQLLVFLRKTRSRSDRTELPRGKHEIFSTVIPLLSLSVFQLKLPKGKKSHTQK